MKSFALVPIVFFCASVQAQNIEGQIIASQYGKWRVPGYSANTYSFAPDSCRVQGGASFFFAFTTGTPITIVDANPSLTETLTPTALVDSNVTCSISIAPVNDHQLPFYVTSATGGLQEALNQNFSQPQANTIILDNAFYQLVGGSSNVAEVIATVQGSTNLGLVDVTQVPTIWYRWNGARYVAVGPPTNGGSTLVNDLFSNGPSNAWQDLNDFVATDPILYNPQAALTAANAHNGTVILQPASGRAPFVNTGNVRVQDNRSDVAATARGATEFGAVCDLRSVYGTLSSGSNIVTIIGGYSALFSSADIGRTLVATGTVAGTPTAFETAVASITDSNHAVTTTPAPFSQSINHQMDLGHDDTAAITQAMNAVGGGDADFPSRELPHPHAKLKRPKPYRARPAVSDYRFSRRGYLRRSRSEPDDRSEPGPRSYPRPDPERGCTHRRHRALADRERFWDHRGDGPLPAHRTEERRLQQSDSPRMVSRAGTQPERSHERCSRNHGVLGCDLRAQLGSGPSSRPNNCLSLPCECIHGCGLIDRRKLPGRERSNALFCAALGID